MTDTEVLIDPEAVNQVFRECLVKAEEVREGHEVCHIVVESLVCKFAFHVQRLEEKRGQVREWLAALPSQFHQTGGGGSSFLAAYRQANRVQWTNLHIRVEMLFSLGLALGLVGYVLPRDQWDVFPRGMPYYVVLL